ncbi:mitochondrial large subunit ribosomal protein-domain-containing protein [Nemania abortiva]|nr:mitochondrial large subunit ribosomal protein-domain-containing protein [Nemania abortiva]
MLSRSLRPATSQAARLATTPIRSNTRLGPFGVRTLTIALDADVNAEATEPAAAPAPSEPNAPRQLPYFVGRNNLNNLSIYQKSKRGGNYKLTVLKKGEGDLVALKQDIKEALQLPDSEISINSVTKHIMIKGHKYREVKNFLHTIGF